MFGHFVLYKVYKWWNNEACWQKGFTTHCNNHLHSSYHQHMHETDLHTVRVMLLQLPRQWPANTSRLFHGNWNNICTVSWIKQNCTEVGEPILVVMWFGWVQVLVVQKLQQFGLQLTSLQQCTVAWGNHKMCSMWQVWAEHLNVILDYLLHYISTCPATVPPWHNNSWGGTSTSHCPYTDKVLQNSDQKCLIQI